MLVLIEHNQHHTEMRTLRNDDLIQEEIPQRINGHSTGGHFVVAGVFNRRLLNQVDFENEPEHWHEHRRR